MLSAASDGLDAQYRGQWVQCQYIISEVIVNRCGGAQTNCQSLRRRSLAVPTSDGERRLYQAESEECLEYLKSADGPTVP